MVVITLAAGEPHGLTADQLEKSEATLCRMADACEADISCLRGCRTVEAGVASEFLVRCR